MPTYVYRDELAHVCEMEHRMFYSTGVVCDTCGAEMRRVPQAPMVNWNGDNSRHPLHPSIKRLIDTASQRRDKFYQEHEAHERNTASPKATD